MIICFDKQDEIDKEINLTNKRHNLYSDNYFHKRTSVATRRRFVCRDYLFASALVLL